MNQTISPDGFHHINQSKNPFIAIPGITEDHFSLFQKSILNQTIDYPDPVPVINLMQHGEIIPFLTKKSLSLWQGMQKSKKTTVLAIAVASMIIIKYVCDAIGFKCAEPGVVLFFDNEQGRSYAAKTMRLILKLASLETSENLIYCDLREYAPSTRKQIIEAGIAGTPNVKLVVIDGIVDLMDDFMDAKEGHTTVSDLLKLCSQYDIHIAGVLHQNKGAGKDARAHVGSISSQKCEREIMAEVDPDDRTHSIISSKESRGLPFENFAIRWDKGSLPYIVQDWVPNNPKASKKQKTALPGEIPKETHLKDLIAKALVSDKAPKYNELSLGLQNVLNSYYGYNIPQIRVREYIQYYIDNGLLFKVGNKPHTRYQTSKPAPTM